MRLDTSVASNLKNIARALGKKLSEITVVVLDRDRHVNLIAQIRKAGARVRLITDGDVAGALATCTPRSGIDVLMGIGGSTEAVLAAVAIKILGGEILCRFQPKDDHHARLVKKHGLTTRKIYSSEDLAKGKNLEFTATGVIDGPLLTGVRATDGILVTHSLVIRGQTETMRYITTHHHQ